jgi:hypothetical protein
MWVQTWVHMSVHGGILGMPINRLSQLEVTNAKWRIRVMVRALLRMTSAGCENVPYRY